MDHVADLDPPGGRSHVLGDALPFDRRVQRIQFAREHQHRQVRRRDRGAGDDRRVVGRGGGPLQAGVELLDRAGDPLGDCEQHNVVFGTVNAARRHYEQAADALAGTDPDWLNRLLTRRVDPAHWTTSLTKTPDAIKVVVTMQQ